MAPVYAFGFLALTILGIGLMGSTRRIGFWLALLASILLTPIGGLVLTVLSGPPKPEPKPKPKPKPELEPVPAPAS